MRGAHGLRSGVLRHVAVEVLRVFPPFTGTLRRPQPLSKSRTLSCAVLVSAGEGPCQDISRRVAAIMRMTGIPEVRYSSLPRWKTISRERGSGLGLASQAESGFEFAIGLLNLGDPVPYFLGQLTRGRAE